MKSGGGYSGRKILGQGQPPYSNHVRKEKDDQDLVMFREMHKREKDRVVSLLQPVSDEFEPQGNGNYPLYRIPSGKKSSGYDFLAESNNKNDYDWLKTPPATPLFLSLEMEDNAPELIVQRELPVIQPLSRFSGNSEPSKTENGKPKSHLPTPRIPQRAITPTGKPTVAAFAASHNMKISKISTTKTTEATIHHGKTSNFTPKNLVVKPKSTTSQNETHLNTYLTTNLSKNTTQTDSKTKPRSRGVSPLVRSMNQTNVIPGFSDETPPNLRTDDRSSSATRGRAGNPSVMSHQKVEPKVTIHQKMEPKVTIHQKMEPKATIRRQSCSPSMSRERKQEISEGNNIVVNSSNTQRAGKIQTGNGTQVFGSKMVDKFMNARKLGADQEREAKPTRSRGSVKIESSGYGKILPKVEHLSKPRQFGTTLGNSS